MYSCSEHTESADIRCVHSFHHLERAELSWSSALSINQSPLIHRTCSSSVNIRLFRVRTDRTHQFFGLFAHNIQSKTPNRQLFGVFDTLLQLNKPNATIF